jgi:hypothetical protein
MGFVVDVSGDGEVCRSGRKAALQEPWKEPRKEPLPRAADGAGRRRKIA